jgi:hypothetical protein
MVYSFLLYRDTQTCHLFALFFLGVVLRQVTIHLNSDAYRCLITQVKDTPLRYITFSLKISSLISRQ